MKRTSFIPVPILEEILRLMGYEKTFAKGGYLEVTIDVGPKFYRLDEVGPPPIPYREPPSATEAKRKNTVNHCRHN